MSINNVSQKKHLDFQIGLTRDDAKNAGYNLSLFDKIDELDGKKTGTLSEKDLQIYTAQNEAELTFKALKGYTTTHEKEYAIKTILAQTPATIAEFILAYYHYENRDKGDLDNNFLTLVQQINTEWGWNEQTKNDVLNHIKTTMLERADEKGKEIGWFTRGNLEQSNMNPSIKEVLNVGYAADIYLLSAAKESIFGQSFESYSQPSFGREMYLDSDGIQKYMDDNSEVERW